MNAKDIVTVVGLAGLCLYQLTTDPAAAVQTGILILGYFGLLHKADETNAIVGRNAAPAEPHRGQPCPPAESRQLPRHRRTK